MSDYTIIPRKERIILSILANSRTREMYGLDILKASKHQIVRGTLYTTLQRMEAKGLVSSVADSEVDEDDGVRRRRYFITGLGQRVLAAAEFVETGSFPATA